MKFKQNVYLVGFITICFNVQDVNIIKSLKLNDNILKFKFKLLKYI